jgi:hypothetical protein
MVGSAIEAAQRASDQAMMQLQAFLDAGDHRNATLAQVALADSRANLLRLQEQKAIVEEDARRPQPQQPVEQPFDPNAAMQNIVNELSRTGLPRAAQWIRSHPEWVQTRERIAEVDRAHQYALNNLRLAQESDEYFARMEEMLGVRGPPVRQNYVEPRSQALRGAPVAAPVNSGAPSYRTGESRQTTVHLTPAMRDHAHNVLGMTDEEYAAELLRAHEDNKLLITRV